MDSVGNKMAKGAAWMVAFKIVEKGIGLVSTIILARLLNPDDFGLVAIATAFLGFLILLTDFNFDVALIQKQHAGPELYDTAWTFNVLFGLFLAFILAGFAKLVAEFYNEPKLEDILYVFAISAGFGGFCNIGPVAFRKELQFHKEFYFQLFKKLTGFSVCMVLAFTLRNYWALVWGSFAGRIMELLISYLVHPYRPRFCMKERKELFGFSIWLFVNNTIFFTYHRLADFIISKVLGSHALGVYTIAYEISNLPTTELVAPINRAVLPGYSKMACDIALMRQGFLNVLSMIALCALPAGIGIAIVADLMVKVVLGSKWQEAVPLIQVLAISGAITALQTNTGSLYMALGKPRYLTFISSVNVFLVFIPLLITLLKLHGVLGIAEAYLCSNLIMWPINYFIVGRLIQLSYLEMCSVIWRPFLACGFMAVGIIYGRDYMNIIYPIDIDEVRLVLEVVIGAFIYMIGVLLFWVASRFPDGAEKFILRKLNFI